MSLTNLRHGIFLPPFHPNEENPTQCLERDLELMTWLDKLGFHEAYFAARDVRCSTAQPMNATLKPAMNSEAMSTIKEMHRCSCAPVRPLRPRRLPRQRPSPGSHNASGRIRDR